MRHILSILAALLLCDPAQAQTVKALSYNTNGDVVYGGNILTFTNAQVRLSPTVLIGTNFASIAAGGNFISMTDANGDTVFLANTNAVTFYDAIAFSSASNRANSRTNLSLGATWLTNTDLTNFRTAIGLGETNNVTFSNVNTIGLTIMDETNAQIAFEGNSAARTRTNLGLPLAALTNISNVTMMRALAGSTNTNQPFSGSISVTGTNNTNTLIFSNGILQSAQ